MFSFPFVEVETKKNKNFSFYIEKIIKIFLKQLILL